MMAMAITLAASIDAGDDPCYVECDDDQGQEWQTARPGTAQAEKTTAATLTERAAAARRKRQKRLNWNTLTGDTG